jgi:hypothetical protein
MLDQKSLVHFDVNLLDIFFNGKPQARLDLSAVGTKQPGENDSVIMLASLSCQRYYPVRDVISDLSFQP